MPTTPLLLWDNYLDTVRIYPNGVIDASEEPEGFEAFRVADYRRERSFWRPNTDGGGQDHWIRVHHTAPLVVNYIVIDRDSTIDNRTVYLEGSADGAVWDVSQAIVVGDPTVAGGPATYAGTASTEEGAMWAIGADLPARAWWRLRIPYVAGYRPIITGLMFGGKSQLLSYSGTFDEDASERTQSSEQSTVGYRASARSYAWRTSEIALSTIGSTEYDTMIRSMRHWLFANQVPTMIFMDYVSRPERGWLFEYDGTTWGMPKTKVLRSGRMRFRELGARIL